MDFRQLRYILAVAEYRSITKASAALYMSQPALSHFVQKVENELGLTLFDRTTNPIGLTYAGEEYIKTAQKILTLNDELQKKMRDISSNITGRLRLGFPRDRASYMLPLLLPAFAELHPGIQIKSFTAGGEMLKDALLKGSIDFMILPILEIDSSLRSYKIYEEELLLAAPKGMIKSEHLLYGDPHTIDINKISDFPFLLLPEGRANRTAVDALFWGHHFKANVFEEYDSNITLLRMAAIGRGVTIIPQMTLLLAQSMDGVELYHLAKRQITWEIQAVYRKDAYIGTVERDFFEISSKIFEDQSKISLFSK